MLSRRKLAVLRRAKGTPNRVALAMELAGLTQVQVAEAIGCTQPSISRIKQGHFASLETSRALARLFGCQIEDLFPSHEVVAS